MIERRYALLLAGLGGLTLISPAWMVLVHTTDFLPDGSKLWLPGYLAWFTGGMMLSVLAAMGARCYGFVAVPLALVIRARSPVLPTLAVTGTGILSVPVVRAVWLRFVATCSPASAKSPSRFQSTQIFT